ncbi:hypothetical protein [Chitinophaga dinghuensis]|nr:hypothetical protein [Chitinophaga dinghuensis]
MRKGMILPGIFLAKTQRESQRREEGACGAMGIFLLAKQQGSKAAKKNDE